MSSREALHSSSTSKWNTPPEIIQLAREVFNGPIHLDPASSAAANTVVQADIFYDGSESANGLKANWHAFNLWLNPPYSKVDGGPAGKWVNRMIQQYTDWFFRQGMLLVNATPDRSWFKDLWGFPLCFLYKRIRFYNETGQPKSPTHGNVLAYFPEDAQGILRFRNALKSYGEVVLPGHDNVNLLI